MFWRHPFLLVATTAYLGFVLWLTLTPAPFDSTTSTGILRLVQLFSRHESTAWITFSVLERGANVALFVPVGGLFLLLSGHRWWPLALLAGVLLSAGIEFVQGTYLPTRVADVADVVMNSIGTLIGIVIVAIATWGVERRHRIIQRQAAQLQAAREEIARLSQRS